MPVGTQLDLMAIALFKASAFVILLVLYFLVFRGFTQRFFRLWLAGWLVYTAYGAAEVLDFWRGGAAVKPAVLGLCLAATFLLFAAVLDLTGRLRQPARLWPLAAAAALGVALRLTWLANSAAAEWGLSVSLSLVYLAAGWLLWRHVRAVKGYGGQMLAAALLLHGLHGLDQAAWDTQLFHLLRVSFDGFLDVAVGVAMAVLVLEAGRARTEDLNEKLRRLTLITAAATQTFRTDEVLREVLDHLVRSLNASHGMVRLLEGDGEGAALVLRAAVGFSPDYLERRGCVSVNEPWARRVLESDAPFLARADSADPDLRRLMEAERLSALVLVRLPGKDFTLGLLGIGSETPRAFQDDEVHFLVNVANLLGLTIQNLWLFEQVAAAQRQWVYTFDSISDPILVHDTENRIIRVNRALAGRLGAEPSALVGRPLAEVLRGVTRASGCPYCANGAPPPPAPDPTFGARFLVSTSEFHDAQGARLGAVHVLRDVTARVEAEEKYRNLFEKVQEGVFISTPDGRFVDFNDAFMRMLGYESRDELLNVEIAPTLYVNPADRERLKRLLREHGAVTNYEFPLRRRNGEVRIVCESSFATRDAAGNVAAYQGFVLDVTERKRAEQEIRRRNRELLVLNSIASTLGLPLELEEILARALRQVVELFGADLGAIYLLDESTRLIRRHAACGFRSDYARQFPPTVLPEELLRHIRETRATVLSAQSLPLPSLFRDLQIKEGIEVSHLVVLWSKERIVGGLVVACRSLREFSPAELNLLTAVGNQIAATLEKSLLHEATRRAYDDLRRTQEQLLQSEKMAAVGQLISGVAHELNNPLTAILGYGQLLAGSDHVTTRGSEYVDKLYKQAQRTHRIVQNLLSFARQHKPERTPVRLHQVLDDTLALREYDLKLNNIRVHREFAPDLALTSGDPHQLQQVFLNILNNAVDAILSESDRGDIWIRTGAANAHLEVEFTDSGPGVSDPKRVFDPFFTTKPVGKGTGLGLSICYGIIKEHGGEILVRNLPPRGASFTITLPLLPAAPERAPAPAASREEPIFGHILLVDDEDALLDLEQEILRGKCLSVRAVRSGKEAIAVLESGTVDVIVTDLKMPGEVTGKELYRWVAERRPELAARVVFTMSDARTDEVRALLEESGCPHIQKPFHVERFLDVLRSASRMADGQLRPEVLTP